MACYDYVDSMVDVTFEEKERLSMYNDYQWWGSCYRITAFDPSIYFCWNTFIRLCGERLNINRKFFGITVIVMDEKLYIGVVEQDKTYSIDIEQIICNLPVKNNIEQCSCSIYGIAGSHYHIDPEPYLISYMLTFTHYDHSMWFADGCIDCITASFQWEEIMYHDMTPSIGVSLKQCNDITGEYYDEIDPEINFDDERTMGMIHHRGDLILRLIR